MFIKWFFKYCVEIYSTRNIYLCIKYTQNYTCWKSEDIFNVPNTLWYFGD